MSLSSLDLRIILLLLLLFLLGDHSGWAGSLPGSSGDPGFGLVALPHRQEALASSSSVSSPAAGQLPPSHSPRRTAALAFTCLRCGVRTTRAVNPHAYHHGTVFAQCGGCGVHHKVTWSGAGLGGHESSSRANRPAKYTCSLAGGAFPSSALQIVDNLELFHELQVSEVFECVVPVVGTRMKSLIGVFKFVSELLPFLFPRDRSFPRGPSSGPRLRFHSGPCSALRLPGTILNFFSDQS